MLLAALPTLRRIDDIPNATRDTPAQAEPFVLLAVHAAQESSIHESWTFGKLSRDACRTRPVRGKGRAHLPLLRHQLLVDPLSPVMRTRHTKEES